MTLTSPCGVTPSLSVVNPFMSQNITVITRRWPWVYALAGIATLYTQYLGAALLIALNLHALLWWRSQTRREWLAWFGANAAIAVGLIGMGASIAVGRNPVAATKVLVQSILAIAFAEAIVFYALLLVK